MYILHTNTVNVLFLPWKTRAEEAEGVCLNLLLIYSLRAYTAYGTRKKKLKRKYNLEPSHYSQVGYAVFKNVFTNPRVTCIFSNYYYYKCLNSSNVEARTCPLHSQMLDPASLILSWCKRLQK